MGKKQKTYGRGPAKRYFLKRAKESNLTIVKRNGSVWWFKADPRCVIVCLRFAAFTLRNIDREQRFITY